MNQEPPDEERLTGTPLGGLRAVVSALGSLSGTIAMGGSASLVLGIALLAFFPDLRLYSYIVLGAGGALLLLSMIISFGTVSRAVTGRRGRYSTNTVLMVIAFIGIAAVANYLGFENHARFDVTATKKFSLAPRTAELLKNLQEPVEAKAFFGPPTSEQEEVVQDLVDSLLHEFTIESDKFDYEFVDPDANPEVAREYRVTQYGNIVFEGMERNKRHQVPPSQFLEQNFVTGLLIVTGQEQKQVYFLSGHDERRILDYERDSDGFGLAHDGILGENYAVSTINVNLPEGEQTLLKDREEGKVNMLVVAGPRKELLEGEASILDDYLRNGGNALFLLDPDTPQTFRNLLARWGILVGDGHILDQQRSLGANSEITYLTQGQYASTIPDPLLDSILRVAKLTTALDTIYYPGVTSLAPADGVMFFPARGDEEEEEESTPTIFGTALAVTSPDSWLIKDAGRSEPRATDIRGPFFPAVALKAIAPLGEEPPPSPQPTSIIVFGDSDFASNGWYHTPDNSDFFLNSVNWLVGDAPLANIRPKASQPRVLTLTRNEFNFVRYSGWLLLPALMALAGSFVWWKRR